MLLLIFFFRKKKIKHKKNIYPEKKFPKSVQKKNYTTEKKITLKIRKTITRKNIYQKKFLA